MVFRFLDITRFDLILKNLDILVIYEVVKMFAFVVEIEFGFIGF